MGTLAERKPSRPTPPPRGAIEQRLLLHDVTWDEYEALGEALQEQPALRLTYDRGNLEIMKTGAPPAPTAWTSDSQQLVLYGIGWSEYTAVLQGLDRHHLRTAYEEGGL